MYKIKNLLPSSFVNRQLERQLHACKRISRRSRPKKTFFLPLLKRAFVHPVARRQHDRVNHLWASYRVDRPRWKLSFGNWNTMRYFKRLRNFKSLRWVRSLFLDFIFIISEKRPRWSFSIKIPQKWTSNDKVIVIDRWRHRVAIHEQQKPAKTG